MCNPGQRRCASATTKSNFNSFCPSVWRSCRHSVCRDNRRFHRPGTIAITSQSGHRTTDVHVHNATMSAATERDNRPSRSDSTNCDLRRLPAATTRIEPCDLLFPPIDTNTHDANAGSCMAPTKPSHCASPTVSEDRQTTGSSQHCGDTAMIDRVHEVVMQADGHRMDAAKVAHRALMTSTAPINAASTSACRPEFPGSMKAIRSTSRFAGTAAGKEWFSPTTTTHDPTGDAAHCFKAPAEDAPLPPVMVEPRMSPHRARVCARVHDHWNHRLAMKRTGRMRSASSCNEERRYRGRKGGGRTTPPVSDRCSMKAAG